MAVSNFGNTSAMTLIFSFKMNNMIKVLPFRFLFRHFSNHVIVSVYFWKYVSYDAHLFSPKCWKVDVDFRNAAKNWEKAFCFSDDCILIACGMNIPQAIMNLPITKRILVIGSQCNNSSKIPDNAKRNILQLDFSQSHETIWGKCCVADFNSVWDTLTCWLSKGVQKRDFLDS